jgi:hypothetical protein
MKLRAPSQKTETSQIVERRPMGMSKRKIAHLIGIMINQYTDPVLASIREYAANALDSHRMAGQTRPIRVQLPSPLNPVMIIEDWGVGMSLQELDEIFAQYGESSKDGDNTQIGGFGIGGKAGFAVADQFLLSCVKDGMRTEAVFARSEAGGELIITSHEPTDAPNGVRVTIAVRGDVEAYATKARDLFQFWSSDEVEVVGVHVEFVTDHAIEISESFRVFAPVGQVQSPGGVWIRMGGIAYPITAAMRSHVFGRETEDKSGQRLFTLLQSASLNAIIDLPIGTLDLAPSREALMLNEFAPPVLAPLLARAQAELPAYFQRELDSKRSQLEATRHLLANRDILQALLSVTVKLDDDRTRTEVRWRGRGLPVKPAEGVEVLAMMPNSSRKAVRAELPIWNQWPLHVLVVDTEDEELFEAYVPEGSSGNLREGSGVAAALHLPRRGCVRKLATSAYKALHEQQLDGWATELGAKALWHRRGAGSAEHADEQLLFVLKSQADKDLFLRASHTHTITLSELRQLVKDYRAANRRARKIGGAAAQKARQYDVSYQLSGEGAGELTVGDLAEKRRVWFIHASESRDHEHVALDAHLRERYVRDDEAIVQLTARQSLNTFIKRIEAAGGPRPQPWRTRFEALADKRLRAITQTELHFIEQQCIRGSHDPLMKHLIAPLIERHGGLRSGSERFESMLRTMRQYRKGPADPQVVRALHRLAPKRQFKLPRARGGILDLVEAYPLLNTIAIGLGGNVLHGWRAELLEQITRSILAEDAAAAALVADNPTIDSSEAAA